MRKYFAGLAGLGLSVTLSTPMAALATAHKTAQESTVVERATLTPIGKTHVHGTATVTINVKIKTLTVVVNVSDLVPRSIHADHIHVDSVSYNKYILKNLVADSNGNATSTTVFHNVTRLGVNPWLIIDHGPNLNNPMNASVIAQGVVK